jgi:hypothetical protein
VRGKYPGIAVTPDTYNLFKDNIDRDNARRKEKAWLKGKTHYKYKLRITDAEGTESVRWIERLVMEHAPLFSALNQENQIDERNTINTPEAELSGVSEEG